MMRAALLLLLLGCSASALWGQQPTQGDAGPGRIELEPVQTIGSVDGPLSRPASIARGPDGKIYLSAPQSGQRVLVYHADGSFDRFIGREGEGPGEFRRLTDLFFSGGKLHAVDAGNQRVTIFGAADGVLGTRPLPPRSRHVVALDSLLLANATIPTRDLIGYPLHLVDSEGEIVRSLGEGDEVVRPDQAWRQERYLAPAEDGESVWAAPTGEYVLEQWNARGDLVRRLRRNAAWFPEETRSATFDGETPPPVRIRALRQDEEGRLWVLTNVPDEAWQESLREVPDPAHGGSRFVPRDPHAYWDTMIEIIDPGSGGRLLASTRVDPYFRFFVGEDELALYRENEQGIPQLEIWRARPVAR